MKTRRDKRDALFSELVRERASWLCEKCGAKPAPRMLHCSHFFGRCYRSTRWHPDNAAAHCFGCHQWFTDNPIEFSYWIRFHFGKRGGHLGHVGRIQRLSRVVAAFKKHDLAEIEADLKVELQLMRGARAKGVVGRIEFAAPRAVQALEDGLKARAA